MKLATTGLVLIVIAAHLALSSALAATFTVDADDDFFQPASIEIAVGDTVQWNFVGANPHTVTSETPGLFDSGVQTGGTFSHTFNSPGTFHYLCTVHGPSMSGTVVVVEQQPDPTNTPAPPTSTPPPPTTTPPGPVTSSPSPAQSDAPAGTPETSAAPDTSEPVGDDAAAAPQLPAAGDGSAWPHETPLLPAVLATAGVGLLLATALRWLSVGRRT